MAAKRLARSDLLRDEDGRTAAITSISEPKGRFTVYNLEVAGTHTYFAGEAGWWVHNTCPPDLYRGGQKNHPGIRSPRPDKDIPVDEDGMVYPGTGGQSHFETPDPNWEYTWQAPPGGGDPPGLHWDNDSPGHWNLEPAEPMSYDQYKEYLRAYEEYYKGL